LLVLFFGSFKRVLHNLWLNVIFFRFPFIMIYLNFSHRLSDIRKCDYFLCFLINVIVISEISSLLVLKQVIRVRVQQ